MPETLLTVDEAADRLKIKPATLRSQLRAGRIASVRTGKMWRIPESALEPQPPRRDIKPTYCAAASTVPQASTPQASTPQVSTPQVSTRSELDALFAPSTPDEIARQLDALDKLTGAAKSDAPETDLSGDRGEVYGYTERENRQL